MSSEANIRSKTGKLPVQLYRTFFKVSIAAAIYGVFCVLTGGGEITSASLAAAISVLGAIAYEVVYFLYKSSSDAAKSKGENEKERQLKTLLRFFGYLLGISLLLNSAALIYDGKYYALVTLIIGMALCQQMHNNKYLFSHLSTFFESAVIASAIITLELMFYAGQGEGAVKFMWSFGVVGVVLSEALAQTFFHFYNCQKHGNKAVKEELLRKAGKDGDAPKETDKKQRQRQEMRQLLKKKTLIVDRVTEFLRDLSFFSLSLPYSEY